MGFASPEKLHLPEPSKALKGRSSPIDTADVHFITGHPLKSAVPAGMQETLFGMGCFWGAERMFWQVPGVWLTAVGYTGGYTPNPTYDEVCTGLTGHVEVVRVIFDPVQVSYSELLRQFFQNHDPTQGMRQGGDVGTQYRSAIFTTSAEQADMARRALDQYQSTLDLNGYSHITTEILPAPELFYAEDYHQQYLAKNPNGYCGLGGTGIACPVGLGATSAPLF